MTNETVTVKAVLGACDMSTCAGCCSNGVCKVGTTADACGSKGATCLNCGTTTCNASSNTCTLNALGAACTSNADCQSGDCMTAWPGGSCTEGCDTLKFDFCPSGASCGSLISAAKCMKNCTGVGSQGSCRDHYRCIEPAWSTNSSPIAFCSPE